MPVGVYFLLKPPSGTHDLQTVRVDLDKPAARARRALLGDLRALGAMGVLYAKTEGESPELLAKVRADPAAAKRYAAITTIARYRAPIERALTRLLTPALRQVLGHDATLRLAFFSRLDRLPLLCRSGVCTGYDKLGTPLRRPGVYAYTLPGGAGELRGVGGEDIAPRTTGIFCGATLCARPLKDLATRWWWKRRAAKPSAKPHEER